MTEQYVKIKNAHILFDANFIEAPNDAFFDMAHWQGAGSVLSVAQGRGAACIFEYQGNRYVLRHYRRGGMVAKLSDDRYMWSGLEQTRAWREWRLLAQMCQLTLPVPRPVAARVQRHGLLYSADLVMQCLTDALPLADILMIRELPEIGWREIGATIGRFHRAGIFHADLNARNILIDKDRRIFLIDFDKGEKRAPEESWQQANLERLQRSLIKFKANTAQFFFDDQVMEWLLAGYKESSNHSAK